MMATSMRAGSLSDPEDANGAATVRAAQDKGSISVLKIGKSCSHTVKRHQCCPSVTVLCLPDEAPSTT